jgi:hypothetical protein
MYIPLRTQLIQDVPWFYIPCFKHLEFLCSDHKFSWNGERNGGPDASALIYYENEDMRIEVRSWLPMNLPSLRVASLKPKWKVLDFTSIGLQVELEDG